MASTASTHVPSRSSHEMKRSDTASSSKSQHDPAGDATVSTLVTDPSAAVDPKNPPAAAAPAAVAVAAAGPAQAGGASPGQDPSAILHGKKLAVVFASLMLCVLLIALDQTILATALPRIATDFQAFTLQGWVSSAFVLTQTAFVLIWGQFLRIHIAKWVLLICVFLFELGSVLCGAAPTVYVLIVGRAVSGVGAAGIFTSAFQILAQVTLLKDRPKLFGLFGAVFGLSSIIGPLIGGGFTDNVTWRWCFYINLPVGGIAAAVVFFFLKPSLPLGTPPDSDRSPRGLFNQTLRMDWVGAILALGAVTTLAMALQWGGNIKPWSSAPVIVCFVVSGVTAIALGFWMWWMGDRALVPFAIFDSWSIAAIVAYNFMIRAAFFILVYYIPIFFQATRDHSATKSGLDLLPLMIFVVVCVIGVGQLVGRMGRYWYFLFVGPVFECIGGGLLYTVSSTTSTGAVIGYQILCGIGIGSTMQNGMLAAQAEYAGRPKLLSQATGLAIFGQFLGGTIGLAISESVFSSGLRKYLAQYAPTAPYDLISQSPLAIWQQLDPSLIQAVVVAYVKALDNVYIIVVPLAGISIFIALGIKNLSTKGAHGPPEGAPKPAADGEKSDGSAPASLSPSAEDKDASEKV